MFNLEPETAAEPSAKTSERRPRWRMVLLTLLLLMLGIWMWMAWAHGTLFNRTEYIAAGIAILLSLVPWSNAAIAGYFDRLRHPSIRQRRLTFFVLFTIATCIVIWCADSANDLFLKFHDEHSYMIGSRMLARGRLWMPAHQLADFLDSFHILVRPVYASIYFPGTSLINVPAIWLNLPHWIIPALLGGASVGLIYLVIGELIDNVYGIIAALLLLAAPMFRTISVMLISQTPSIFLGLLIVWIYLRWRRRQGPGWAVLLGIAAGLAAITRPVEAIAYTLPVGVAILLDLRGRPLKQWAMTIALIVACAMPFLALQVAHNVGTTGSWSTFASDYYVERNYPAPMLGFHTLKNVDTSQLTPAKQDFLERYVTKYYNAHKPELLARMWREHRFPLLFLRSFPTPPLIIFIPIGLIAVFRKSRWVLFLSLPITLLFYVFYVFFLEHYSPLFSATMIFAVLLGIHQFSRAWGRTQRWIERMLLAVVAALAIASIPPIGSATERRYNFAAIKDVNRALGRLPPEPAVVLIRYTPGVDNPHRELVYNPDVAWPDDAEVIRLNDLGDERNVEVYRYYAERQPYRVIYRYDRATGEVRRLGRADELAAAHAAKP